MGNRSTILVLTAAMLGTVLCSTAAADLVGWWKLDDGSGTIAVDSSGSGNDGTVINGGTWIEGPVDGALEFDSVDDYIELPIGELVGGLTNCSFTVWANFTRSGGSWQRLIDFGSGPGINAFLTPALGGAATGAMRFAIAAGAGESLITAPTGLPTGWHHVTVTIDATTMQMALYQDGVVVASGGTVTLPTMMGETTQNWLGRSQYGADGYYSGSMDDVRIYDHPLGAAEVAAIIAGEPYRAAAGPQPGEGATEVVRDITLGWVAGEGAETHNVYFGTDYSLVAAGDPSALVSEGQTETTYTPGLLDYYQFYYWRVDELAAGQEPVAGPVWSFRVLNFVVVDDFEAYNDEDNLIYDTWLDGYVNGTGSLVGNASVPFAERVIVHSGVQSMPFAWDNFMAPRYSEAELAPADADWTADDVLSMALWINGDGDNSAEPLYMGIEDAAGNSHFIAHPNPAAVQVGPWQEWIVLLSDVSDAGVDLTSVSTFYLGVGNRQAPVSGFNGTIYVDDIRLYQPRCRPDIGQPEYDFNDDCIVNQGDLDLLMTQYGRALVDPASIGAVYREAESADVLNAPMQLYSDDETASQGQYIGSEPDAGDSTGSPPTQGVASYNFSAPSTGVYKVLLRLATSPGNDSLWVRITPSSNLTPGEAPAAPGQGWIRFNEIADSGDWHWDEVHSNDHGNQVANWTLSAGAHTLEIKHREAGVTVDSILIAPAVFSQGDAVLFDPLVYDLNGDEAVDDADVAILMDHWLEQVLWP